jgi:hypothetical protein
MIIKQYGASLAPAAWTLQGLDSFIVNETKKALISPHDTRSYSMQAVIQSESIQE